MRQSKPEPKVDILFLEKYNHQFRRLTKSHQASGLSICVEKIVEALPGAHLVRVENTTQMAAAIRKYKPKKVVLESIFIGEHEVAEFKRASADTKVYVHIHSNIPFMGVDANCFGAFASYKDLDVTLICNNVLAGLPLASLGVKAITLENIYFPDEKDHGPFKEPDHFLDVACFGSVRPMKNHITQAVGAILCAEKLGKTLRFHCNMDRIEGGASARSALKHLFTLKTEHQMIHHDWMEHKDFLRKLRTMDIGLQVSMTETFNIVSADYVNAGIPMVVSSEIDWCADHCYANHSDPDDIAYRMEVALKNHDLVYLNRINLKDYSESSQASWTKFINS